MRKLLLLVAAGVFAVGVSTPAKASTLSFTGTLSFALGALPPVVLTGSGVADNVDTSGALHFQVLNGFAGAVTPPASLFTGVPQINGLKFNITGVNATTQTWAASAVSTLLHPTNLTLAHVGEGGPGGLGGSAVINILGFIFLTVPIGVVGGGSQIQAFAGPNPITVIGERWTNGTARILNVTTTPSPGVTNPAGMSTLLGTDARAADHGGMTTFVTPGKAITGAGLAGNLALITSLKLNFVPEPGTLLLLGSGAAGFALLARRRMRK